MSDDLNEVIAAHEATNAQLLLRIAELEARAPREPFDVRCADSLADEVAVLVRRGIIDSRSPAADALQDYRNPPPTERSDTIAALREQVATLQQGAEIAQHKVETEARFSLQLRGERDAAKADAARLRAELQDCESWIVDATRTDADSEGAATEQLASMRAALAADDSAAWLESKIAERTAPLEKEIERWAEIAAEKFSSGLDIIREREKSLQQQLVAATNDAARAELRARDLSEQIRKIDSAASTCLSAGWSGGARRRHLDPALNEAIQTIAASPDSDERLREVLQKAVERTVDKCGKFANITFIRETIDEVLRGGA